MRNNVQHLCLGHSVQGLRVDFHCFDAQARPPFSSLQDIPPLDALFLGAFHGDEPESAELCFRLLHDLHHDATLGEGLRVGVVPIVNPDGLLRKTRKNQRNVDLNRNFETQNWAASSPEDPYHGGVLPFSEPESRYIAQLVNTTTPTLIVSYHTPYRLINYDGPLPQAEELAECYAHACAYPAEASIGYPTPGSFGNWAGVERGIPVLTVELPEGERMNDLWPVHRGAIIEVFNTLKGSIT
jgi:protein MpaA